MFWARCAKEPVPSRGYWKTKDVSLGAASRCRGDALAAYCMLVNCGPAKGCCLPDIDRHRRLCARGLVCGAMPGFDQRRRHSTLPAEFNV